MTPAPRWSQIVGYGTTPGKKNPARCPRFHHLERRPETEPQQLGSDQRPAPVV
jgi:hypothetical protein